MHWIVDIRDDDRVAGGDRRERLHRVTLEDDDVGGALEGRERAVVAGAHPA